jgi:hypothetical protein
MILSFALVGSFTATIAAIVALLTGQQWWVGLAAYVGGGMVSIGLMAALLAVTMNSGARKTDAARLRTGMPLADH